MTEDAHRSREVEPFGKSREDRCHLLASRLEAIHGRTPPLRDLGFARLAEKVLNPFTLALMTIADQGMDLGVANAVVRTLAVRTGVPIGLDPLLPPAFTLDLRPGKWQRLTCQQ